MSNTAQAQEVHHNATSLEVQESAAYLKSKGVDAPRFGIVLGTGLSSLTSAMENKVNVPYEDIPHFPETTALSHVGNVVSGQLGGQEVLAMEGRYHYYEGHSLQTATYPIPVLKALGIETLILSNAAGGMNKNFSRGDLMLINDHINFMGDSPLVGANDDDLGPRFPDMIEPYSIELLALAKECAQALGIQVHEGVYVGVKGPQLETKAEYRMLRQWGADAVGMSTVPEAIRAVHAGLKTLAVSCITDMCIPEALQPINIEEIIKTAQKSEPQISQLVTRIIQKSS